MFVTGCWACEALKTANFHEKAYVKNKFVHELSFPSIQRVSTVTLPSALFYMGLPFAPVHVYIRGQELLSV